MDPEIVNKTLTKRYKYEIPIFIFENNKILFFVQITIAWTKVFIGWPKQH